MVKHSKASLVKIDIEVTNKLVITIADNGLGINFENLRRFGNGLKNMHARLENINGSVNISNNNGAVAVFEISL